MRIQLRLANLLGLPPFGQNTISQVAREIGISRHRLLHLLEENPKQINRAALEAVCTYLVKKGRVSPAELPHALFVVELDRFWSMAKSVKHVLLTVGSKSGTQWQDELVVAADAILLSTLVNRITSSSSNSPLSATLADAPQDKLPPTITTQLVPSWNRDPADDPWPVTDAKRVMDDFTQQLDGRALICLGTVKSNPVAELAITHLFSGCDAFQDQQVAKPEQRGCPFAGHVPVFMETTRVSNPAWHTKTPTGAGTCCRTRTTRTPPSCFIITTKCGAAC